MEGVCHKVDQVVVVETQVPVGKVVAAAVAPEAVREHAGSNGKMRSGGRQKWRPLRFSGCHAILVNSASLIPLGNRATAKIKALASNMNTTTITREVISVRNGIQGNDGGCIRTGGGK